MLRTISSYSSQFLKVQPVRWQPPHGTPLPPLDMTTNAKTGAAGAEPKAAGTESQPGEIITKPGTATVTTAPWKTEADALGPAKARLQQIRNEAVVGEALLELAEEVIEALARGSLVPSRVVVTADRELAFVFFGDELVEGEAHRLVATLTCSDDGVSVLTQDRREHRTQAWDLDVQQLGDTLEQICSFVSGR